MNNFYPYILGIMDTLNEWNDKFNDFAAAHLDSPLVATVVVIGVFFIAAWGIRALNKK